MAGPGRGLLGEARRMTCGYMDKGASRMCGQGPENGDCPSVMVSSLVRSGKCGEGFPSRAQ